MVNFFIGRPIFATVLALLMLLIGGICIFVLPISLYPDIVPPQVQITATYTGADAQTVADSVTTPIEQKVNGVNGMIYMSSDSTSNGLSRILVTLDVGYSQDIGAIDVQNKVDTAKPTLPAEVTQVGVESKKTTTNMVCVVNLVSPKGTYDVELPGQLRPDQRRRRPQANPRDQRRQRLRPEVRHADLARPGQDGQRADLARRGDRRDQVREPAGRRRQDRRPARARRPAVRVSGHRQGPAVHGARVRGHHRPGQAGRLEGLRSRTWPGSSSARRTTSRRAT